MRISGRMKRKQDRKILSPAARAPRFGRCRARWRDCSRIALRRFRTCLRGRSRRIVDPQGNTEITVLKTLIADAANGMTAQRRASFLQSLIYVGLGLFALATLSIAFDIQTRMQVAGVHAKSSSKASLRALPAGFNQ